MEWTTAENTSLKSQLADLQRQVRALQSSKEELTRQHDREKAHAESQWTRLQEQLKRETDDKKSIEEQNKELGAQLTIARNYAIDGAGSRDLVVADVQAEVARLRKDADDE